MTEEHITKSIIRWLKDQDWQILSFDFPQSGTGRTLHPNSNCRETTKNKGGIIPDIVAVKNEISVFFENKNRYIHSDFKKLEQIKITSDYSQAIYSILKDYSVKRIAYGVGGPNEETYCNKALNSKSMVDFIIVTDGDYVKVVYEREHTF